MNCAKVKETLYLFFDEEMESSDQDQFKQHLAKCPHCARRVRFTRNWLVLVRQSCSGHSAPRALRLRIVANLPHRRDSPTLH